jgi:hypothetical protein
MAMNLLFRPVGLVAGFLAGFMARKAFDQIWLRIDDSAPPDPGERDIPKGKFVMALVLEGVIFTVTRGLVDHYSRVAFYRYTGAWPGEKKDD